MEKTEQTPAEKIAAVAADLGITMSAVFVPFSQSRNAKPQPGQDKPWQSLNWRVTLMRNGRDVLTTDYGQGIAHAPAYKWKGKPYGKQRAIEIEIETGMYAGTLFSDEPRATHKPIAPPPLPDVLWSLIQDASVLDEGTFEDWARSLGYSPDSRAAEAIWKACLEIALKLRGAVGETGIEALREAGEDF